MVLAAADGADGYWHPHASGDDPQGMLMDEFLPMLHGMGVVTDRIVGFGWSMGGYGAMLLAETFPDRISRVGAESPAIWPSYGAAHNANPTAFDSAADWSAHDVVGHLAELGRIPVRIDCGLSDPFVPASRRLAGLLEAGHVTLSPGAHDSAFWKAHAPAQLRFLAS
jgi:S-formylglutathione hydrolase FrmB